MKTHPDASGVVHNVTLHASNTNLKYGNPLYPNEEPVQPTFEWEIQKIALLEFPHT